MRDFDIKEIKRYQRRLSRALKREEQADGGSSFVVNSRRVVESSKQDVQPVSAELESRELPEYAGSLEISEPQKKPESFEIQELPENSPAVTGESLEDADATPDSESLTAGLALIAVDQPAEYTYLEVFGVDNTSGRRIRAIIPPQATSAHMPEDMFEKSSEAQQKQPGAADAVPGQTTVLPEVIYLPGDIYKPAFYERILRTIFAPRLAAAVILAAALLAPLWTFYSVGSFYFLSDETENPMIPQRIVWSRAESPREVATAFTALDKADRVEVVEFGSTQILNIVRSFPVTLKADGKTVSVNVLGATVGELLEITGVEVSEDDILSMDLDHVLLEDDELVIKRVTYKERVPAVMAIPHGKDLKPSPLLSEGKEIILSDGADGVSELVFIDRFVNGLHDSFTLVRETVLEDPTNAYVMIGDPAAPASELDKDSLTDRFRDVEIVDGVPTEYADVIPEAVCTAYSFGPNTFGASGMMLVQGFVATNPDIIPYGTLMYIASDRFTYGWAVAADCGTAMMEGYVDIDCYFETYSESVQFGKKLLDVYIIGQLTQAELEEYAANGMFYGRVPRTIESSE